MADTKKVLLFELDIDLSQAVKAQQAQAKAVEDLAKAVEELEEAEGKNSKATIEKTAELKVAQAQLRENKKTTEELIKIEKQNEGSIEQLRRKLAVTTIEWKKLSKEERTNTKAGKDLAKQKLALTNALKEEEKATGDTRRNVGNYKDDIDEASQAMGLFGGAAGQATQGMKQLGIGIKALTGPFGIVIAAIGLIVSALTSFFTSSEEGQNTLKRLGAIFETVMGNIIDLMSALGKALLEPKKFIDDLRETFSNTFGKVIEGVLQVFVRSLQKKFQQAGLLFEKFKGLFTDNAEDIKAAQDKIIKTDEEIIKAREQINEGLGNTKKLYDDARQSAADFIKEQEREIRIAQALADREAELVKLRRFATVEIAKNRSAIQDFLLVTRDQTKSFQEQRDAILQSNKILEDQLILKEKIDKENLAIIESQNALSNSTIEDLDREAEAEAQLFNTRAENAAQRRELANRLLELDNRIRADQVRKDKAELDLKRANALVEKEILDDIAEHRQMLADEALEAQMVNFENQYVAQQNNIFAILDLEREGLAAQQAQEIEFAEKIGADVNLINEKFARANVEIKRAEENAKLSLAADFAGNIASIVGEGTALGKAAAVAQATISTYQGATSAYAALAPIPIVGPGLGAVAAGAAIAAGLANVKKILAVKTPGGGGSGGSSIAGGGSGGGATFANVNPSIGQGIATRADVSNNQTITGEDLNVQSSIVVDEVTDKQNNEASNKATSDA